MNFDGHTVLSPSRPHLPPSPAPYLSDGTNHGTLGLGHRNFTVVDSPDAEDEMPDAEDSESEPSTDDVTEDSRDVLVKRLNNLAHSLSAATMRAENVDALHAHVDAIEKTLSTSRNSSPPRTASLCWTSPPQPLLLSTQNADITSRDAIDTMTPVASSWLKSSLQRRPPVQQGRGRVQDQEYERDRGRSEHQEERPGPRPRLPSPGTQQQPQLVIKLPLELAETPPPSAAAASSVPHMPQMSSEIAGSIVEEAESLCTRISTIIESLQKRCQESHHLHTLRLQREEAAQKRALDLSARVAELQETVAEDESELRYLKIQLRGIEAQCMGYIPKGADPELAQSIRNWKRDWASLRDRWAAKKNSSFVTGNDSSLVSALASPSAQN